MPEAFYSVTFRTQGKIFRAKVFPTYEDGSSYFHVHFKAIGEPEQTIFLEMQRTPNVHMWKIKEGDYMMPEVSGDFVYQLGSAIEAKENYM